MVAKLRPAEELSLIGLREHQRKLALAIEYTLEQLELGPMEVTIRHWSDLDIGKGMGSSTADVLAGIRAIADAAGRDAVCRGPMRRLSLAVATASKVNQAAVPSATSSGSSKRLERDPACTAGREEAEPDRRRGGIEESDAGRHLAGERFGRPGEDGRAEQEARR